MLEKKILRKYDIETADILRKYSAEYYGEKSIYYANTLYKLADIMQKNGLDNIVLNYSFKDTIKAYVLCNDITQNCLQACSALIKLAGQTLNVSFIMRIILIK